MTKLKVLSIILISNHGCYLRRSIDSIINQKDYDLFDVDILVNINTTTENFYEEACAIVAEYPGVQIIQTKSNGKPGMGHNSCLEEFKKREQYDYMFLLDGDDVLYPYAYHQYQKLLTQKPDTDLAHLMINDNISTLEKENQHVKLLGNFYMYTAMNSQENWWKTLNIENPFKLPLFSCRTPSRILLTSRKIFTTTYKIEYSNTCKLYDDFMAFLSFVEAQHLNELNTVAISDPSIYCYNGDNDSSATFNFNNIDHQTDQYAFQVECTHYKTLQNNWDYIKELPYEYLSPPDDFSLNKRIAFCNDIAKFEILDRVKHAEHYQREGDFRNASMKYKKGIDAGINSESVSLNYGLCMLKSNKLHDAINIFENVLIQFNKDSYDAHFYLSFLYNQIGDFKNCQKHTLICLSIKETPQMNTMNKLVEQSLQNTMIAFKEPQKRVSSAKPIVCFYTGYSDYFNGKNYQERTVYGSENAVVHMAEEMTADYQVFVFCPCRPEDEIVHNGVTYMNLNSFGSFQQQVHINIMIVSRYIHFFHVFKINADKVYLWVHDAQAHDHFSGKQYSARGKHFFNNLVPHLTGIICVSPWHRRYFLSWSQLEPQFHHKVKIIGNAIVKEPFDTTLEKKKNRFVWCSDVTRGLDILLNCFPRILDNLPDATLDIYFGSISKNQLGMIEDINKRYGVNTVKYNGKIPQAQLCKELCKSDFWFYSTSSHETSCISAMQALQAKCIVVTRKYSGLADTVGKGGKLISGDPQTEKWQASAINYIVGVAGNPDAKKQIQDNAPNNVCDWGQRYQDWKKLLE